MPKIVTIIPVFPLHRFTVTHILAETSTPRLLPPVPRGGAGGAGGAGGVSTTFPVFVVSGRSGGAFLCRAFFRLCELKAGIVRLVQVCVKSYE